jgi:hypothetical protein
MRPIRQFARSLRCLTIVCAAATLLARGAIAQQSRTAPVSSGSSDGTSSGSSTELNLWPASYLDPNLDQSAQSVQQFAEGQSSSELFAPSPEGPLKSVSLATTWLGGDDLGFTDFELSSKFGWFDIPQHKISLLTLTPLLGVHFVDGPDAPDLPGQLYDMSLDIKGLLPLSQDPVVAVEVGLTPGLFSDFEHGTDEALRISARVVGYYVYSPTLTFALGASYNDRFDVEWLVVGGVVWKPNVDTNIELTFPKARFARRFNLCGETEDWWYIVNEFSGGAWAVERTTGAVDIAAYRDLRLSVGWEHRTQSGFSTTLEAGWVFNRTLEYRSGGEFEQDDTFMIKGTVRF